MGLKFKVSAILPHNWLTVGFRVLGLGFWVEAWGWGFRVLGLGSGLRTSEFYGGEREPARRPKRVPKTFVH